MARIRPNDALTGKFPVSSHGICNHPASRGKKAVQAFPRSGGAGRKGGSMAKTSILDQIESGERARLILVTAHLPLAAQNRGHYAEFPGCDRASGRSHSRGCVGTAHRPGSQASGRPGREVSRGKDDGREYGDCLCRFLPAGGPKPDALAGGAAEIQESLSLAT